MNSKNKGNSFERDICKKLSLWWTIGESDDVFWRTASSGGRATQRAKKSKTTAGGAGDLMATDDRGQDFTKCFAIEIKRGYNKLSAMDILDSQTTVKDSCRGFIEQAMQSAKDGKSLYWMLIFKRDKRDTLVFVPHVVLELLTDKEEPCEGIAVVYKRKTEIHNVMILRFDDFLKYIKPQKIMERVRFHAKSQHPVGVR